MGYDVAVGNYVELHLAGLSGTYGKISRKPVSYISVLNTHSRRTSHEIMPDGKNLSAELDCTVNADRLVLRHSPYTHVLYIYVLLFIDSIRSGTELTAAVDGGADQ